MKLKGFDEGRAIRELKELGKQVPPNMQIPEPLKEKRPFGMTDDDVRGAETAVADDFFAQEYLHQRGISDAVWKELRFGYVDSHRFGDCDPACSDCGQHAAIVIPWIVDGKIGAVKYRRTDADATPRFTSRGSTKGSLYGADLPAIGKHNDCAIIVEGELDVALLRSLGFNGVTFGSTSGTTDALNPAL